jgi:aspartate racemase
MNAPEPLLGILGGMGPQAGIDLAQKLIASTRAENDQGHVPFVLFSLPGPVADRTAYLLGESDANPAYAIADQLESMSGLGVTVAVMACNTAHAAPIFDVILEQLRERQVNLRLLHLVSETVACLGRDYPDISKVGVLGTSGTYQSGLYERALEDAGLKTVLPEPDIREGIVHAAIYDTRFGIKATAGTVSVKALELVRSAIAHLGERGAEAVILGCTELPLVIDEPIVEGILVLDPARIMAERITRVLRPGRSAG